jgi:hypothetical protein
MKNYKFLTSFFFLLILGCGSDGSDELEEPIIEYNINSISPLQVKIGDTIKISGTNLTRLHNTLYFLYEDSIYSKDTIKVSFITRDDNEITLKIPEVYHENIILVIPKTNNFKLEIVGMIPTISKFNYIEQIQVLDENTAFLLSQFKIYKSKDGFYKWDNQIELANKVITSFFFLNENVGWVAVWEETGNNIYLTVDGGNSFTFKYHINNFSNNSIRKIRFVSPNRGLFKDNSGNIFIANNDSFENIYDYYPNLSALPFGKTDLWDFTIINENLIFLDPNDKPYLIKINNQNITYSEFDFSSQAPFFFENIGYVQVNSDIYKTLDFGDSWSKIKTFEDHYPDIHFFNGLIGCAIVQSYPDEFYLTEDGGMTWRKYFTFPKFYMNYRKDFSKTNVLMCNYDGRTWKYRKEE